MTGSAFSGMDAVAFSVMPASHHRRERTPAVDDYRLPGDPGGVIRKQERDRACNIRRHSETFERVARGDLLLATLIECLREIGLDDGGRNRVDPDARCELERKLG